MDEQRYVARSPMPVPARELFDWHARPGAFERLNPPFDPVEVLERSGGIAPGARTVLRVHLGPVPRRWIAVHTAMEEGRSFTDRQESGPFARWEQVHRMLPDGESRSFLEDDVRYTLPLGLLGRLGAATARERLESIFAYRHALTAADLARHAELPGPRLRVGITGSHGLIGDALALFLTTGGHLVTRLGRGETAGEVDGLDAVVNLAGAGVGDGRWTAARKREIRESRVRTTEAVVAGILRASRRPSVLVNGSAMGFYGDRGETPVDESSSRGTGFLAEVVEAWEAATLPAEHAGVRVVKLRTGVVLSPDAGRPGKDAPPLQGRRRREAGLGQTALQLDRAGGRRRSDPLRAPDSFLPRRGEPDRPRASDQRRLHPRAGPGAPSSHHRRRARGHHPRRPR